MRIWDNLANQTRNTFAIFWNFVKYKMFLKNYQKYLRVHPNFPFHHVKVIWSKITLDVAAESRIVFLFRLSAVSFAISFSFYEFSSLFFCSFFSRVCVFVCLCCLIDSLGSADSMRIFILFLKDFWWNVQLRVGKEWFWMKFEILKTKKFVSRISWN